MVRGFHSQTFGMRHHRPQGGLMVRYVVAPEEDRDHDARQAVNLQGHERFGVVLTPTAHSLDVGPSSRTPRSRSDPVSSSVIRLDILASLAEGWQRQVLSVRTDHSCHGQDFRGRVTAVAKGRLAVGFPSNLSLGEAQVSRPGQSMWAKAANRCCPRSGLIWHTRDTRPNRGAL